MGKKSVKPSLFVDSKVDAGESWFAAAMMMRMANDGIDTTNESEVLRYLESFDPVSVVDAVEEIEVLASDMDPAFPPIARPVQSSVESSASRSPLLTGFVALAKQLGTNGGRAVGEGRIDDDQLQEYFGSAAAPDPRRKCVVLEQLWDLAVETGVVRVFHDRFVAEKKWTNTDFFDAGQELTLIVQFLADNGPYISDADESENGLQEDELQEEVNDNVVDVLGYVYLMAAQADCAAEVDGGVAIDEIVESALEPNRSDRAMTEAVVDDLVRIFCLAGVLERPSIETVRLTPAGRYSVREMLLIAGFDVPFIGELADVDAETMLQLLSQTPWPVDAEIGAWVKRRPLETALLELLDAIANTSDSLVRVGGFVALDAFEADVVRTQLQSLLTTPARVYALMWLDEHNLDEHNLDEHNDAEFNLDELTIDDLETATADQLVLALHSGGRVGVLETLKDFDKSAPGMNRSQLVGILEDADDHRAAEVIEIVNELPAGKPVAKAARRILARL